MTQGPDVVLAAPGLVLDAIGEDDVDALTAACRDPEATRFLNIPFPYERSDAEEFVRVLAPTGWATGTARTYAIRERADGPILGTIALRGAPPAGDLGINLAPAARGRGLATRAARRLVERAAELGFETLEWECLVENAASAALARRLGFEWDRTVASCSDRPHLAGRPADVYVLHRMA